MALSPRARSPGRPVEVESLWRVLDFKKTKSTDQQVALSVGAIGGVPTRDKRGNVLEALWVKYSERSVVGMLLETNDIRKILLDQIQDQLKARRDLIQEIEQNDIVCRWLMAFTKSWETEYSKQINSRFDIGQLILSVMSEAYFEVLACRCLLFVVACRRMRTNARAGSRFVQPLLVHTETLWPERHAALLCGLREESRTSFQCHAALRGNGNGRRQRTQGHN